jgi:1,4-dihydroxy-2-naphthoate octaprenyltransferase
MAEPVAKSTITCDMEGRIETFNGGAEAIFGYSAEEVVGKKRVSLFSPGLTVLEHVPSWLKQASEEGAYEGQTVFVRKDGSRFAADIRITPTYKRVDGEKVQMGYCGVTMPRPDLSLAEAGQPASLFTRIFAKLVIIRGPFLTASIIPVLIGAAWVAARGDGQPFPWLLFVLTLLGAVSLHIAANTLNDYFDWISGADPENNGYFLPYSGGSRSIELGLITPPALKRVGLAAVGVAGLFGLALLGLGRPLVLLFGAIGAFSAYFYTAPPLRLIARKGLGELLIGLNFGVLLVAGTAYALTGTLSGTSLLLGLPIGLFITAILWINQFPDMPSDRATGKENLVVVLGLEKARYGYLALMVGAFASLVLAVTLELVPATALLMLLALPMAAYTTWWVFRHYGERTLVRANVGTIALHVVAGLLLTAGLLI